MRSTRVVLITDRHVAYLRARHMRRHSIYKAKWLVPIAEMQNLSGEWLCAVYAVWASMKYWPLVSSHLPPLPALNSLIIRVFICLPAPSPRCPPHPPAGDSESLKISLTHVHRYNLWLMGVWPVQKRKGMRCASRAIYERTVIKLSRLLQKGRGEGGEEEEEMEEGLRRFAGADLLGLTINSQPYIPPPPPGWHHRAVPMLTAPAAPATGSVPPTPQAQ